jgi:hypothetical protein
VSKRKNAVARKKGEISLNDGLSTEADTFLGEATAELNAKHEALQNKWRFGQGNEWGFDQQSGVFRLSFADGSEFEADGQILGSYSETDGTWEWAWNNPNVVPSMARDSKKVKALGKRLNIAYLQVGTIPMPPCRDFAVYLSAIGVKGTNSIGYYTADAGPIKISILLKNPRWARLKAA